MTTTSSTSSTPDRLAHRLGRRWPTAIGALAAAVSLVLVSPLPDAVQLAVGAWGVLLAAVIYLGWDTARGALAERRLLATQVGAVLAFGAVAVAAVAAGPDIARYGLAAAWLAHAAWDVAHHRAGRVVPRWWAETCAVIDVTVALFLLAVGTW